jgi:hypothetical protein
MRRVKRPMPPPPPPLWVTVTRRVAWTLGVGALVAGALLWAGAQLLQAEPAVPVDGAVAVRDIERALALVRANDPRLVPHGVQLSVVATQQELDLLLSHAARRRLGVRGRVVLGAGEAQVVGSLMQRVGPWSRWVNVRGVVREGTPLPQLVRLQVGTVPLPGWLAQRLVAWALPRTPVAPVLPVLAEAVRGVAIAPGRLQLRYQWSEAAVAQLMDALVAPAELARLRDYHGRLGALLAVRDSASGRPQGATADATEDTTADSTQGVTAAAPPLPLVRLLAPLLGTAAQRAAASGDAGAEVRAALLTVALYLAHQPLGTRIPAAAGWPALPRRAVLLAGREDLAAHFVVSALVVVEGTTPLAQAVGVYKELQDSRPGGSGFSFADLAADLAGTRFGELAQRNPAWLAERMARGVEEGELLPSLTGMPEGVDSATLALVYGGAEGAGTRQLRQELARRVDTLALYR